MSVILVQKWGGEGGRTLGKQCGGAGGDRTLRRGLPPAHSDGGMSTGNRTGHCCWRLTWPPRCVTTWAAATSLAPCGRGQLAQLATVCNDDLPGRLPTPGTERFDFLHDIHAFFDMAKHDMLAIQPVS